MFLCKAAANDLGTRTFLEKALRFTDLHCQTGRRESRRFHPDATAHALVHDLVRGLLHDVSHVVKCWLAAGGQHLSENKAGQSVSFHWHGAVALLKK